MPVIEAIRSTPAYMVLVFDEYGHFEGIVTAGDILSAILGGDPVADGEPALVMREDGSWLVAGWMPVDEFAEMLKVPMPRDVSYNTVAGHVLSLFGSLPQVGATIEAAGWRYEIVDRDGLKIDKVLVSKRVG